MQETRYGETFEAEIFEADASIEYSRQKDKLVAEMNDALIKNPQKELLKRTFFKDRKSANKAQKQARKINRK